MTNRDAGRSRTFTADSLAGHAARGLWAGAAVLLLGSAVDLFVLWGLQFRPSMQWEFVAIVNTLEGYTRLVLGVALVYGALLFGRSGSLAAYRIMGVSLLVLGVVAVALGLLLFTDYLPLSRIATGQGAAEGALVVTAVKGFLLSGLYALILVPLGVMGLRKPRIA